MGFRKVKQMRNFSEKGSLWLSLMRGCAESEALQLKCCYSVSLTLLNNAVLVAKSAEVS